MATCQDTPKGFTDMKTKKADSNKCLKLEALVRKYLHLDPGALARLGAEAGASLGTCESGLHEFMRRVLERAIGSVWLPDDAVIRLSSAKVPGWPDAKTYNLAQLLSWALVREPRRMRGKPQLPLLPADPCIVDFLPKREGAKRTPVLELLAVIATLFDVDFDNIRDAPGPDARQPVAIASLIREMLGVEPTRLVRPYYDAQKDADEAIARDPEAQAVAGLSALLTRSVFNFPSIPAALPPGGSAAFWIGRDDAEFADPDGVDAANLRAVLMAGLCADGLRQITFVG